MSDTAARRDELVTILAQVNCADMLESTRWYEALFGRPPDARPMDGLVEWHHGAGGLQLYRNDANAGHSSVTLIVTNITDASKGLMTDGFPTGEVEAGDHASFMRLHDPDNNLVVLTRYYSS